MARILLADQSEIVLDLMRIFLSEDGHQLSSVSSSAHLHEAIAKREERPELLILSADLGPESLTECITTLRNLAGNPSLAVLVTIAPGTSEVQHEIDVLSKVDSINKPFDRGSFLAKIKVISMLESFDAQKEQESNLKTPSAPLDPAVAPIEPSSSEAPPQAALTSDLVRQWIAHEGQKMVESEVRRYLSEQGEDVLREIIWKIVPELAEDQIRKAILKITEELEQLET
jgi:CheY-like chemotaxis protein